MTTATHITAVATLSSDRSHPLRRATLTSAAISAATTTAFAAVVHAADVPLETDGKMIRCSGSPR